MNELKHTPGPWVVGFASPENIEKSTLAIWQQADLAAGKGIVICKVSPELQMNETDKANAKLIAAAPELLEALLFHRKFDDVKVFSKKWEKLATEHIRITQAALKKAGYENAAPSKPAEQ